MAEPIPFVEPLVSDVIADAVAQQVASGFLGPGKACQAFAGAVAAYAGVAHANLTTSGTIALSVAAKAFGVAPGDEIIVPAYGVISTTSAFASFSYAPRLVDIDAATGCMAPEKLEAAITPKTKAVCFVNFSGHTGEPLTAVADICKARGLPLIEDAACAMGHAYRGKRAGSFGAVAVYSFSVPKIVTTGQGGAVLTNDPAIHAKAGAYIDHGDLEWRRTNLNRKVGTNLRFNDVLAALGNAQMRELDARLARRRAAHAALRVRLGDALHAVPGGEAPLHNVVFVDDPAAMAAELRGKGVHAGVQYRTISEHPPYASLAGAYPGADYWTRHALYLPFGVALTEEQADRVGAAVHACSQRLHDGARSAA